MKDIQSEMWKLHLKTASVSLMWESNALKAMAFRNPERATQLLYEALRSDYAELSFPKISAQLDANDRKILDEATRVKRDYESEAHNKDQ